MEIDTFIGKDVDTKDDVHKIFSRRLSSATSKLISNSKQCENEYDFSNEFMGLAVIISNGHFKSVPRKYCIDELKMMKEIFGHKTLNFTVVAFNDLTAQQMNWVLDVAAEQNEFHQKSNCFACVIGSHGTESPRPLDESSDTGFRDHCFYGTDDISINTKDVINRFSDVDDLENKPKLFFIQACRSTNSKDVEERIDQGHEVSCHKTDLKYEKSKTGVGQDHEDIQDVTETKIIEHLKNWLGIGKIKPPPTDLIRVVYPPCQDDCVVIYASSSGKQAYGRDGAGGWMLKALHTVMLKHLEFLEKKDIYRIDIMTILTEMAQQVSQFVTKFKAGEHKYPERTTAMAFEHCLYKEIYFTYINCDS